MQILAFSQAGKSFPLNSVKHTLLNSVNHHTTIFWEKVILLGQFTKNSKKIQTGIKKTHQKILKGEKQNHDLAFSIVIHLPFLLINQ